MKKILCFVSFVFAIVLFTQCKKDAKKLENPFGLMLLGSDTSLPDGKYVIRTPNGCGGYASTLRCDYIDGAIDVNGTLTAVDHINHYDIDSAEVWYVKKVRYRSPDPYYALAFGYRIYQLMPDGSYRFLAFTATGSTSTWTDDEIGFTFGDGNSKSAKVGALYKDFYPLDPMVPTYLTTSDDTAAQVSTRYLFQLYASTKEQGAFNIKAGGSKAHTGAPLAFRWNFCLGFFKNTECEVSAIYPHFRDSDECEGWNENGNRSRRCYITDIFFQKVY